MDLLFYQRLDQDKKKKKIDEHLFIVPISLLSIGFHSLKEKKALQGEMLLVEKEMKKELIYVLTKVFFLYRIG